MKEMRKEKKKTKHAKKETKQIFELKASRPSFAWEKKITKKIQ